MASNVRVQPMKLHVKKGDTVRVISGNDKGKSGVVKEALPREGLVLVEGINLRWKNKKPTQQNPKGERIQREVPIHVSNVQRAEADGGAKKKAAKKPAKAAAPEASAASAAPAASKPKATKKSEKS